MKNSQSGSGLSDTAAPGRSSMKQLTQQDGSPNSIRILIYHRIYRKTETGPFTTWDISETVFRRHLELLDKWGYSAITFRDYRLYQKGALSLPKKPVIITFDDGNEEVLTVAYPIMKEHGMRGVVFLLGDRTIRSNTWDEPADSTHLLLSDQQVLELHNAGFEIGAHSFNHRNLTSMSLASAWEEIYRSRMALEFLLNAPVKCFAYPYGMVNAPLKQMVADAGYELACGAFTGPAVYSADPLELRRIRTYNSKSRILFWFQLQSIYLHYRSLWWNVKTNLQYFLSKIRAHIGAIPENGRSAD